MDIKVRFKKLAFEAVAPKKAHADDAGFDLTAISMTADEYGNIVYGFGLAVEIPKGYVGLLFPRSSNAKKNILLSNSVGCIDSGFRGEIKAKFKPMALSSSKEYYAIGDRVCQLIIMPYPEVEFEEADELTETDRGAGGYGSTGR